MLLAVSAGGASARAAATCSGGAAVAVQGPPDLVRAIERILEADGVGAQPPGCPGSLVRAALSTTPGERAFGLRVSDQYGRSSAYRVSDPADAASLIESWASLADGHLAGPGPAALPYWKAPTLRVEPERLARRTHWIALVDLATGRDGTTWYGSSVTDCMEMGVFCVGPRLRLARDDGFTGSSQQYRIRRKAVDVMMVEAYPVAYHRLALMPSAAFGFGWMRSRTAATPGQSSAIATDLGFRAELSLMFAVRLTPSWSLGGEIGASYSPGSSTWSRARAGAPLPEPPLASVRAGIGFQLTL